MSPEQAPSKPAAMPAKTASAGPMAGVAAAMPVAESAAVAMPIAGPIAVPVAAAVAVPSAALSAGHPGHTASACVNCGAALTGNYCANCGQRAEHEIHSIWHFTREVTEDLTHADSRLWSTMLALLLKPGLLTREFLAGRRVRYLPPLRLYLVLSVVFFLILGLSSHEPKAISYQSNAGHPSLTLVNPDEADGIAAKPGETPEQRADRVCRPDYQGPLHEWVVPFIAKGCRRSLLDNGHTVSEATLHNLPRAMFLFVPALAVVMKLLYRRPRRFYVEHLLFFIHNHAFVFTVFGLYVLLLRIVPTAVDTWLGLLVWIYTIGYLFVAMRRVYEQGRFQTFLKFTALAFTYLFGAALTLALTLTYSVYAL